MSLPRDRSSSWSLDAELMPRMETTSEAIEGRHDQAALAEAARNRDPSAWSRLFDENFQSLYRYAYYRIHNHHAAEELASQVFEEALRSIVRFDYRGITIRAWLFTIARNVTVDYIRKNSARRQEVLSEFGDSHDEIAAAGIRTDLLRALHQLKEEQQQVIILRFLEDLSLVDTAQVVRKSVDAVKSLQARGLRTLREQLAADAEATA